MHASFKAAVVAGFAAKNVAAFGWSVDADKFSSPANCNNQCSPDQQGGYNFGNAPTGPISSYGSNNFGNFHCGSSSGGAFGKRNGGSDNCIYGELPSYGSSECPSMSSGEDNSAFSLGGFEISADQDTDVHCVYGMPGGDECHQIVHCPASGASITNNQCGGATAVSFQQPSYYSTSAPYSSPCTLSIHSMSFNCGSSSTSVYVPTSTPAVYTTPASSVPTPTVYTPSSQSIYSSSTPTIYSSSSLTSPVQSSSSPSVYTSSSLSSPATTPATTPIYSSPSIYSSSASSPVSSPSIYSSSASSPVTSPASSPSVYSTGVVSSPSVYSTGAVSSPSIYSSSPIYPISSSSASIYSSSSLPVYSTGVGSSPVSSAPSSTATPANCPSIVPSCLNTWMYESGCADNTDASCYCKNEQFINDVMECISAWGSSCEEQSQAASYLIGICAADVGNNGALVTAVPSCATIAPSAAPTPYSSASASSPISTTAPVPASYSTYSTVYVTAVTSETITTCPVGHTLTTSGSTTVLSTPSVITTSYTATSTVSIVTSTPVSPVSVPTSSPSSPASYSSASVSSPVGSTPVPYSSASVSSPVSTVPAVPSTVTLYSTSEITITSCAPTVTNCPASSTIISTTSYAVGTTVTTPTAPAYTSPSSPASSSPVGPISSPAAVSSTVTLYSTQEITITSCAPTVTNCPASSTVVQTSSYAVGTTVTAVTPSVSASASLPVGTSASVPSAPATPVPATTIPFTSTCTIPATYTSGTSAGATIPSSYITSAISTTLTVPQVSFTTTTVNGTPSVVLGQGPSSAPAATTAGPVATGGSTGTLATYATGPAPTASPSAFTGAGNKVSGSFAAVVGAAVVAALL